MNLLRILKSWTLGLILWVVPVLTFGRGQGPVVYDMNQDWAFWRGGCSGW